MSAQAERADATRGTAMGHGAAGLLFGAASVALFSAFTLVSRAGLTSTLQPWDLIALRFGIGGLLLLPVFARKRLGGVAPAQAMALAFTGGLGFAACAYVGFALAPATHGAVLLHGTLPLSTHLLAHSERGANRRTVGLVLIASGVAAMAVEGASASTPRQWLGDGALLLASFSWATYGLLARRLQLPPSHLASIVAVLSASASIPMLLLLPGLRFSQAPWQEWALQAAFQGVLIGIVSLFVYSSAVTRMGPRRTALATAAVPCVTTLGAMLFLGESPSALVLAGIALVTAGMGVSLSWRGPRPTPDRDAT